MILLLGATGFLGRHVLSRLEQAQMPVRVLARGSGDWRDSSVEVKEFRSRGLEVTLASITSTSAVERAVEGCSCIINLIGVMRPEAQEDLDAVQVQSVKNLLELAATKGIQRYIHVSCLGAEEDSDNEYLRTKWEAEQLVKSASCYWTIFRPSVMFGERFKLIEVVLPLIKFPLFMPLLGSGTNRLQPVFVEDVASCVVSSIYDRETVGKSYDLAGPDEFTMKELMAEARSELGLNANTFNVPSETATKAVNALQKILPKSSINLETAQLLLSDWCTTENALVDKFKIEAAELSDYLPTIVGKK